MMKKFLYAHLSFFQLPEILFVRRKGSKKEKRVKSMIDTLNGNIWQHIIIALIIKIN